jgi:basic amino acid/polyamine antiporter, APA family
MIVKPGQSDSSRLVRALGPWMAMAVVIGTVIGSGVFKKPQLVADKVPNFGMAALVWLLGGVLAFLGALALAEVAVLYPKAGGNYVFLREGYSRLFGFLFGWVEFWMIRGGSLAALATVFAESLGDVLGNQGFRQSLGVDPAADPLGYWERRGLTVGILLVLALVNVRGVKWGGVLQVLITAVKVGSLLAILALPFAVAAFAGPEPGAPRPNTDLLRPTWPDSWSAISWGGVGTALLGVMFAYHGWMNIAPVAEEVRQPQRNLPLALLGGTAVVLFLYLGANLAYYLIIPRPEMAAVKDTTVATLFSERLLGPAGAAAVSAAVMFSTFGALNGNLLVGPRLLYAMGEDGLAPRALGAVHARYRTPAVAILVMAGWAAVLIVAVALGTETGVLSPDKDHFNYLTDFAMFGAIIFETLAVATIFVFRWKYPDAERPYRCPGYPVVPVLYVAILILLVINTFNKQRLESLVGVGFIGVGAVVYYLLFSGVVEKETEMAQSAGEG